MNDNLAAIQTLKQIEAEGRRATPEEQAILARYVGWGGLKSMFPNPETGQFRDGWEARNQQLQTLLTPREYDSARSTVTDAHYTSKDVVEAGWAIADRLGFKGGVALESSMGIGNFIGLMPDHIAPQTKFVGIEFDSITARIGKLLYPNDAILHTPFQKVPLPAGMFDIAIGNPPFGKQSLHFQFSPGLNGLSIHNQFFLGAAESLKPGGIMVQVVSRYLMDAKDERARKKLAAQMDLVGAIRLPDTAFKENARTEVVTDLLVFRKREAAEAERMRTAIERSELPANSTLYAMTLQEAQDLIPAWVYTTEVPDPLGGEKMTVNAYFANRPEMILGTLERSGSMQYQNDITVRQSDAMPLREQLNKAIARLPQNIVKTDAVLADTITRHNSVAETLEIYLNGRENGDVRFTPDGRLVQVVEREAYGDNVAMHERELSPESVWSASLMMNADGKWFEEVLVLDEQGNKVKQLDKDGKATRLNLFERKVYEDESHIPQSKKMGKSRFERMRELTRIRDLLKRQLVLESEDAPAALMEQNRASLRESYEKFQGKHGFINDSANASLVSDMPDGALLLALEMDYRPKEPVSKNATAVEAPKPSSAKSAAILTKRVIEKYTPPTSAQSLNDAVAISLAEFGHLDLDRIAGLMGTEVSSIKEQLLSGENPLAFFDPERQGIVSREEYLAGKVVRKLNAAKLAGLTANIAALEKVIPERWGAESITPLLSAPWIPAKVYQDFIKHLTGAESVVYYQKLNNLFDVRMTTDPQREKSAEWGTERLAPIALINAILNNKAIRVMDHHSDGSSTLNLEQTRLANIKAKAIKSEFSDWVYTDADRREHLVDIFNERYNDRINRQWDGSHMQYPGKVPDDIIRLRRHQNNAIWRGIVSKFSLYDHAVGAGKTFTAIARAIERKRMGLSNKPTIVVPNHMIQQFAADVYRLYPNAKVLAAGKKDFEKKNRRKLFAKIATGDWDVVIVAHSSFEFINISPETEERFLNQAIAEAEAAITEAQAAADESGYSGRTKPVSVAEAERTKKSLVERLEKLKGGKRDKLLTFEQLGIDDLTIDEAHEFKNLYYTSNLSNVKGMGSKSGSQKALDLYNKVRVLSENPKGSVCFMTGTPISNSAVEMYTMMRYLAGSQLVEDGLDNFDAWRSQFVSTDAKFEPDETNRLKEVNRLGRNWFNMRSLMNLYYSFADVVSNADIKRTYPLDNGGKPFDLPEVKGGDRQILVVQPTQAQESLLNEIIRGFDSLPDIQDRIERNAERLRLMDRARKVSLDVRAIDPSSNSKEFGGKLDRVSDEVHRIYQQWNDDRGTQLIFLDRSVPKSKGDTTIIKKYDELIAQQAKAASEKDESALRRISDALEKYDPNEIAEMRNSQNGGWNAYQQIKDNLIKRGIPEHEIRFIQEANNDMQKKALFDAVKSGEVRVLIGSTPRMGAGTNVQDRLVGLHHVDVTWKPSDIEQREGRIIRQGNLLLKKYGMDNFRVEILAYATERTIDSKMWNLNAEKLKMINYIRNYDGAFTMDMPDEESASMAEIAALASGDPLMIEHVKLSAELEELDVLRRAYSRKKYALESEAKSLQTIVDTYPGRINAAQESMAEYQQKHDAVLADVLSRAINVNGKLYTNRNDALAAATELREAQQQGDIDAKFSVLVNESRKTSIEGISNEVTRVFGDDAIPIQASIDGNEARSQASIRTLLGRIATEMGRSVEKGNDKLQKIGKLNGFDMEMSVERTPTGRFSATLYLLNDQGAMVADKTTNSFEDGQFSGARFETALQTVVLDVLPQNRQADIGRMKARLESARSDLPVVSAKAAQPFAKEDDIKTKQARLEQVIKSLGGAASKLQKEDDPVFSLTTNEGIKVTERLNENQIHETVENLFSKLASPPPFVLVESPAMLRSVLANMAAGGISEGTIPKGFLYKGTLYVYQPAITSRADLVRTVWHELTHYGLRHYLSVDQYHNELMTLYANDPYIKNLADAWMDSPHVYQDLARGREYSELKMISVEEALAELSETVMQSNKPEGFREHVQRAVRSVIKWLAGVAERLGITPVSRALRSMTNKEGEAFIHRLFERMRTDMPYKGWTVGDYYKGMNGENTNAVFRFADTLDSIWNAAPGSTAAKENIRGIVGNFMSQSGQLNWWHKTVGTPYNLAKKHPAFAKVFNRIQEYIGDVSRYVAEPAELAPTIIPQLQQWQDLKKQPISAEDSNAIARPIFEGTTIWMRKDDGTLVKLNGKDLSQDQKEGVVFTPDELRKHFGLNDGQVALYAEFRKAVDTSLTNMAISDMARLSGDYGSKLKPVLMQTGDVVKAADMLKLELRKLGENDLADMVETKAVQAKDLIDRGYAPLSRFGRYTAYVTKGNEQLYFGMYESKADLARAQQALRQEFPEAHIETGTLSEESFKLFQGIEPETIQLFGSLAGMDNLSSEAQEVYERYLTLAKNNRSAMKRMIHRKGVSGYSEDVGRVLANFLYSNGRVTAQNMHAGLIDEAISEIPNRQGELKDAAIQLAQHVRNPQSDASKWGGLMFAQYLGGSVASAMVNLTQPVMMTFPYLSQYTGTQDAAKHVAKAMRDSFKDTTGDKALDAALKLAEEEGIVSPQEVHHIQAQAAGRGSLRSGDGTQWGKAFAAAHNLKEKVSVVWGGLFSLAEQTNRRATFIAAWRIAKENGIENPAKFAEEAIAATQGIYNAGNKPKWARSTIGGLAMTFKQYSIAYVELLNRLWTAGEPGSIERKRGRMAAMLMIGVLFMMSGLDGLPFEQDIEDLIDGFLQRAGFNFSTKREKEAFLLNYLGDVGSMVVLRGFSGLPGVPVDVVGRFGLGNLVPGTGLLKPKKSHADDIAEFAGAPGDFAKRAYSALENIAEGDLKGVASDLLPRSLVNVKKGADMLTTGEYRSEKGFKVNDVSAMEGVFKVIGFQPNSTAKIQDAKQQAEDIRTQASLAQAHIQEKWAQGILKGDQDLINEAREDRDRWNARNPESRINVNMAAVVKHVQAMRQDAVQRTLSKAPKSMKEVVRTELTQHTY